MFKKILVSLMVTAAFGIPTAYAHGASQPSLLNALVSVGNHGSIANVAATVAAPSTLADVHASALDNSVNANVAVDTSSSHSSYNAPPHNASSSVADVNLNVLNAVKANVDVGQQSGHSSTLLGISATVLDGGVGNRQNRW
jgi:hypothetical protein